jgi:hypothetical protein
VDLRIGVTNAPREVVVELADDIDREQLRTAIGAAMSGDDVLWVTDRRGRHIGVPGAKIAFVELGSAEADRRIGFGG